MTETPPPSYSEGEAMVAEFQLVHGLVRRELGAVRALAARVARGATAEEVRAEISSMAVSSPIWALRIHCLHYCEFVHGHHAHEDEAWFPRLRRADPALNPAIDRLEREHRTVAEHLDAIEHHAAGLLDDAGARHGLTEALAALSRHLLEHLDYEEDTIFPVLSRMRDWRR